MRSGNGRLVWGPFYGTRHYGSFASQGENGGGTGNRYFHAGLRLAFDGNRICSKIFSGRQDS